MKKMIVAASSAVIATCLFCTACGGSGYSETFAGVLSENVYTSPDKAIEDFFYNEFSYGVGSSEFVADLSAEELAERFPDIELAGAESAKQFKVTTRSGESFHAMYVLKYDSYYRYLTPPTPEGSETTWSYCRSVFDIANYANCTLKFSEETFEDYIVSYRKTDYTIKITENYISYKLDYVNALRGEIGRNEENYYSFYVKQQDGAWRVFVWDEKRGWFEISDKSLFGQENPVFAVSPINVVFQESDFDSLPLGYKRFIKTENGLTPKDPRDSGSSEFFVKNGVVAEWKYQYSNTDCDRDSIAYCGALEKSAVWSDFGTTETEIPQGVSELLNA